MPHAYTEDQFVEQPAKAKPPSPWPSPSRSGNDGLSAELGWTTVSALEEFFGRRRGDETQLSPAESQSLLTSTLRSAMEDGSSPAVYLSPVNLKAK